MEKRFSELDNWRKIYFYIVKVYLVEMEFKWIVWVYLEEVFEFFKKGRYFLEY